MKKPILAVSLCLGVVPSAAWAVDWSVNSTLSEAVELNNNLYMRSMLAGGVLGSYSTISANAAARTSTSVFNFDGSINYRKYFGPGTEGTQSTESLSGSMHGHYETRGKISGDRNYLDVNWNRQNTSLALLGELGVTTLVKGDIDRTTVAGGIDRALTHLDTLSLSARSSFTTYDPASAGTKFTDTAANATWQHRVNSIASLNVTSNTEWLNYDNPTNTRILLLRETAGLDVALSPLLSVRGSAGMIYGKADGGFASSVLPSSTVNGSPTGGSASGFIGNILLTYKMFKTTTLTLSAVRSVTPSVIGSLAELTSFNAGLSHIVNSRSSLSFSTNISQQTSTGTTSEFFSASAAYSYLLTREWNAQLSYRYLHRFASTGTASSVIFDPVTGIPIVNNSGPASSNSLLLVVSRSISVLPDGY